MFLLSMIDNEPLLMMASGFVSVLLIFALILLIGSIVSIVITWKLFNRAGVEGWKSLIPFYNTYIMIKIGLGKNKTWILLILISGGIFVPSLRNVLSYSIVNTIQFINIAIATYVNYSFFRRFSSKGMSIGAVFIPVIFGSIIAFGDYPYTPIKENNEMNDYGY